MQVVLTGHSLGGGIAKIVSASLGVPVVAVSSPGISLSHRVFNVSLHNIDTFETNLMNVRRPGEPLPLFQPMGASCWTELGPS